MPRPDPLPRRKSANSWLRRALESGVVGIGTIRRRKPPEAGIAISAVPPRGPLPKQGGAEAPLEFD
jgi:hypothetical protein